MGAAKSRVVTAIGAAMVMAAALGVGQAKAQDEAVVRRITKHGQLGRGQAMSLVQGISQRMKRAADVTNAQDPLRMAVSRVLYGNPNASDAMSAAKIRLRLYAGLNEWALDGLFAPRPGATARCQQEIGASSRECDALIAAAGKVSVAEASRLSGGPSPAAPGAGPGPAGRPTYTATQPAAYGRQPAYGQQQRYGQPAYGYGQPQPSRFGTYNSGYRPQPGYGAQPMARPMQQPMAARPMPMAAAANTKADYQRRRQEYLDRQKREMEARKAKLVAASTVETQRGPASAAEAEVIGADAPSEGAPAPSAAKAPAKASAKAAPAGEAAAAAAEEPAAAAPPAKQALDNDFLDSLLDDPLGGTKK